MDIDTIEYELSGDRVLEKDRIPYFRMNVPLPDKEKTFTEATTVTPGIILSTPGLLADVAQTFIELDLPSSILTNDRNRWKDFLSLKNDFGTNIDFGNDSLELINEPVEMLEWTTGSAVRVRVVINPNIDAVREATQVSNHSLELFQSRYNVNIPETQLIQDYFTEHPDIEEVVTLAAKSAREHFDENTEISLEMYYDVDSEDQYLTLYIRQDNYEEDIIEKIDQICESYESELRANSDWFLVTTDFQPPKHI